MKRFFNPCLAGAVLLLTGVMAGSANAAPANAKSSSTVEYQRDVRPILSRYCFKCHGPDDKSRKGNLRLDLPGDVGKAAKSGEIAIVRGKPADSELVKRINTTNEDDVMPPPSTKQSLTPEQKDILKRWIARGATYQEHWAFVAPKQSPLPAKAARSRWVRNPIDAFALDRMEKAGLKPSPEADRYTLVRRVFLDLIGLPPTPEEADAFVNDRSPNAYEALVDRLLASPHYGERWARRWMDLARYSDTNGYEKDRARSIWPYRDWVINALNADRPFDQFTIEQIAGDLLPNPTREQLIATGFHRNTMLNEEGGIDPLEFRFHAMTDRVATTGITWLGLTVGCAQCHTHKYDPIPHREYYQIMAFLDNADEPELDLPDKKAEEQAAKNRAEAATLIAGLANHWPKTNDPSKSLDAQFTAWLEHERQKHTEWTSIRPKTAKSNLPLLTIQSDDSVFGSGDISKSDTYELAFAATKRAVTAIRLEALPDDRLPAHGPGMTYYEGPKGDFFLGELQVLADGKPVRFKRATESYSKNNFGKNPSTAAQAIDGDPQTGWSCADRPGEAHEAVFVLEETLPAGAVLSVKMGFGRHYACSLGRFRFSTTDRKEGAEATGLTEATRALLQIPNNQLTAGQREQLRQQFLLVAPELAADNQRIRNLLKPIIGTTTLIFRERPPENPRATFIHNRGEFLQPTDRVEPGVLTALNPLPPGAPKNRLTFARWLVAKENPMTARVTVNRQWAAFFGRGLVRTTEDFGFQGELPTHPELLDWLSVEFMNQGWSLKKLHKLIVMSATYRQSSATTDKQLSKDGENRWLSRGPRLRLEAELVRDSALKAAGLLTEKIGGPSVFPPQPAGVTTEGAYGKLEWVTSTGADRYRRGLYTFSKRTAPYAMYTTFDAPSGEACVARRDVSNTPLQALTLLNDTVFLETAQALGKTVAARDGSVEERVQWLFRRCLTRPASKEELKKLSAFVTAQQSRFITGGADPKALAGEGAGDAAARAAWTALARVLLNLDESITRG